MASTFTLVLFTFIITLLDPLPVEAKVFMILMDDEPVLSFQSKQTKARFHFYFLFFWHMPLFCEACPHATGYMLMLCRIEEEGMAHKERLSNRHDLILESLLQKGTYTKLYSYTYLLNGVAVHAESEEVNTCVAKYLLDTNL